MLLWFFVVASAATKVSVRLAPDRSRTLGDDDHHGRGALQVVQQSTTQHCLLCLCCKDLFVHRDVIESWLLWNCMFDVFVSFSQVLLVTIHVMQVLATGAVPAVLCAVQPAGWHAMYTAYMACNLGDTLASELGSLSPHRPVMITTWREVRGGSSMREYTCYTHVHYTRFGVI